VVGASRRAPKAEQAVARLAKRWTFTEEMAGRHQQELDTQSYWTASEPDMKAAALSYANDGIPVFAVHEPTEDGCSCQRSDCNRPGKHPRTQHGFLDATTDPVKISNWWNQWPQANIGIPTGAASGLLVVDVDPRNGGDESLESLILKHGQFPHTAEQMTGGGGRHIFFRYRGGSVPKTLAVGVDLKGDGGYVVAAPSLHASGKRYEWDGLAGAKAILNPAYFPAWLQKHISTIGIQAPVDVAENEEKWAEGQRSNKLASVAGTMRRRGMLRESIEAALLKENRHRCDPPLAEAEVRRIAESVSSYKPAEEAPHPTRPEENWAPPIPFAQYSVDPIPVTCLPGWLGEMARATAESTETPFDLAALISIAVASACIASKVVVSPEAGYVEPVNVFTCTAMESGNRKTAVFNRLIAPLTEWENQQIVRMEPARRQVESQRRILEARIDALRRKAVSTPDPTAIVDEIQELETKLPIIPLPPRLYADDCTPERLASLMAEQGGRIAVLSDEGGVFELLAGRYSRGVPNLDLWLKGHSVSPVRVDRADRTRPPIMLDKPHLTVGLSPQPNVLQRLRDKPEFRGRGLLARFLYGLPRSPLGYRSLEARLIPIDVESRYRAGIRLLLELVPENANQLCLSTRAYDEWKDFQRQLEIEFREGGKLQELTDWGGKLAGASLRLAGIFHSVEQVGGSAFQREIPADTMRLALDLAEHLISHARAVFALLERDPNVEHAEKLISWIVRQGLTSFTVRECFRVHQGRFKKVSTLVPVLVLLEQHEYIRRESRESWGGRRPSDLCDVNPALLKKERIV
jgi:Protein of unknown function (DUF3987)/Bifunctional DNA primase/polymerase, N-terminal/Primase C terminal 1 (PriCT-1)